jgi:hypothetical protein
MMTMWTVMRNIPGLMVILIASLFLLGGCGMGGRNRPALDEAPDIQPPPLTVRPVAKNQLSPRAALTWFDNRTTLDPALLNSVFYDRMVPLLQEKARRTRVLLPGETGYPEGLSGFRRDEFGRLDAFAMATFARQENFNAVVTGMVLDATVGSEVGGILLWKKPESRLRLLILVEIYSAETGTKLLNRTVEFETEISGATPEVGDALRPADMDLVGKGLEELAERVGKAAGGVLAELPWQGYVTNVVDDRITLSSNVESGLEPGNMLTLFDSKILDGDDGRKYFLPSHPVGRMQVTAVNDDRTEGVLLQGGEIGIYTFAVP